MEWISVKDRLPKPYKYVLLSLYVPGYPRFVHEGFIDNTRRWCIPTSLASSYDVTHWMPLPEPSKGD